MEEMEETAGMVAEEVVEETEELVALVEMLDLDQL
jgi:hypothetical protein